MLQHRAVTNVTPTTAWEAYPTGKLSVLHSHCLIPCNLCNSLCTLFVDNLSFRISWALAPLYPDGVPRFMHCATLTQEPPDEVTPLVSKTVIGYYQEPFSPTSHLNVGTSPSPYSNDQHSRRSFLLNERNMSSMTFLLHTV